MKKVVIIGIGNRIMKDDGIGVAVAEFLKKNLKRKEIEIIIGETDAHYCLDFIADKSYLIIIDAIYSQLEPGTITALPIKKALINNNLYSQHDMSILELISIHYPSIEGYFIGIEICEIGFSTKLSNCLENKFYTICKNTRMVIEKILEGI